MITINLHGEERQSKPSYVLQIGGFACSVLLLVTGCAFLYVNTAVLLDEKRSEQAALQEQLDRLKTVTKEVRELDSKRQELSARLAVIATLKKNKIGPVRVLDDLNLAMPDQSWLVSVQEVGGPKFTVSGLALDNQTIAEFMKKLESSDYFDGVDLVETKQKLWQGVNIKEFTLQSGINYAGIVAPPLAAQPNIASGEVTGGEGSER